MENSENTMFDSPWNAEQTRRAEFGTDYAIGYAAGFSAASEIIEFATNINTLLAGLINSPMAAMMAKANPQASAALKSLRDNAQ